MTTIRTLIIKLALTAPVLFGGYAASGETLAELRKDLAATAVENSVDEDSKSWITLFIDREDSNPNTYVRWSYNPLRYVYHGWILHFAGYSVLSGVDAKIPTTGYAHFQFSEVPAPDKNSLCYTVQPGQIVLQMPGQAEMFREQSFSGRPFTYCIAKPRR